MESKRTLQNVLFFNFSTFSTDNHLFRIPDDPKRFGSLPELTLGPESPGFSPPDQAQASHTSLNKSIVDALNSQTNIMSESPAIPKQNNSQLETVVQ
jgi:hypothetical protein